MKRKLDVYLHRHLVGNLVQDAHGQIAFDYAETWLNNPAAIALSHSLPLTKKHFTKNECRGFFAGILPEESKREIIAKNLGISARNDYAMLEKIGGECAGAVTFLPAGTELPKREELLEIIHAAMNGWRILNEKNQTMNTSSRNIWNMERCVSGGDCAAAMSCFVSAGSG